jgi:F-type H+-transporting ATPase subunit a
MNLWACLNAARRLLTSALVAGLCWLLIVNSPLWPRASQAAQHPEVGQGRDGQPPPPVGGQQLGAENKPHTETTHDPDALHHVMDSNEWELFMSFEPKVIHLPKIAHIPGLTASGDIYLTKFMILEVIAGLLICAIYIPLARRAQAGGIPRGTGTNFFEVLLTFVRDQIARPSIGEHDADKHVPFLWTMFLFILFNNLLGMVPFGGSPTASLYVTAALALLVFGYMHGWGIATMGPRNYVLSLWPHMDLPLVLGLFIKPLVFVLEWVGVLVRNAVLALRLFANVFAGHMVLATILIFIFMAKNAGLFLWSGITVSSVAGIIALSLLELFVAFLQAFIFTFLTALFLGMALHPEH